MATKKELFSSKKNTLLIELESIKNLLDGQEADKIPLLQDSITPREPQLQNSSSITDGVLPGQRSLFNEAKPRERKLNENEFKHKGLSEAEMREATPDNTKTHNISPYKTAFYKSTSQKNGLSDKEYQSDSVLKNTVRDIAGNNASTASDAVNNSAPIETKTLNATSLSNNPFLPAHVRQRLQRDANNEQSNENDERHARVDSSYTQQLVNQLVAHHLPKIEQELRRKLLDVVKHHNDTIKK
jgi:hypothetical protein